MTDPRHVQSKFPYHRRMIDAVLGGLMFGEVDFLLRDDYLRGKAKEGALNARHTALERSLHPYRFLEAVLPIMWNADESLNDNAGNATEMFYTAYGVLEEKLGLANFEDDPYAPGLTACDFKAVRAVARQHAKAYDWNDSDTVDAFKAALSAIFDDHLKFTVESDQAIQVTQGTSVGHVRFARTLSKSTGGFYPTECAVTEAGVLIPDQPGLPADLTVGLRVEYKFKSRNKVVIMRATGENGPTITLGPDATIATIKHSDMRGQAWKFVVQQRAKPKVQNGS